MQREKIQRPQQNSPRLRKSKAIYHQQRFNIKFKVILTIIINGPWTKAMKDFFIAILLRNGGEGVEKIIFQGQK